MKFKTLIICTILCALIENSLSYVIIDNDRFDGSGDYDNNVEIVDNAVDHTDNYQVYTTDYPHKLVDDHNIFTNELQFYNDLYSDVDHKDIDKDDYDDYFNYARTDLHHNAIDHTDNYHVYDTDEPHKFIDEYSHDNEFDFYKDRYDPNDDDIDNDPDLFHDIYDGCDDHNQYDHDRYDNDGYARTGYNIPNRSPFGYKKRSASSGSRPRSSNILVRPVPGKPIVSSHAGKLHGSRLKPGQLINKRRVMYFRGGQPISRSNLRPVHQFKAKRAMKKLRMY